MAAPGAQLDEAAKAVKLLFDQGRLYMSPVTEAHSVAAVQASDTATVRPGGCGPW
ncbi:hypothetical protein GCM10009716_14120 [Streptomyces sodiiphilus]|uniref:Uncharacterized protein n=1 Tax=Streptomyces sodiiphilus TaxID=226217 RepID=A0ABP5A6R3_9ACTN